MPFLTIGALTVPVDTESATEEEPERGGSERRAFAGNLRSTVRWTKRRWRFTAGDIDIAALRAAAEPTPGAFVQCGGDALGGVSLLCRVIIQDAPYVEDTRESAGFVRVQSITLREV